MLKRLRVRNFQAHAKYDLPLERVTVLVGPSDRGKSSLLRALKYLALNKKPKGDFIHRGKDACVISLDFDEHTVRRKKGKAENSYRLDGDEFKSFSQKVPEEIEGLLNLDENNFQGQLDGPYWFFLTPGEVSKELNRIVNLDQIDAVLARSNKLHKEAAGRVKFLAEALTKGKEKVKRLAWVRACGDELSRLEGLEAKRSSLRDDVASLGALTVAARESRKKLGDHSEMEAGLTLITKLLERRRSLSEELQALTKLADKARAGEGEWEGLKKSVTSAEREIFLKTEGRCPVCGGPLKPG